MNFDSYSPFVQDQYRSNESNAFRTPRAEQHSEDDMLSDTATVRSRHSPSSSLDGSSVSSSASSLLRCRTMSSSSTMSPLSQRDFDSPILERPESRSHELILWGDYFFSLHSKQNQIRARKTSTIYQQLYSTSYMKRYRPVVCDWFFEIQFATGLEQRTVHVATLYMDLCMYKLYATNRVAHPAASLAESNGLFNIKHCLQLLGACCLWISAKRDETYGDSKLKLSTLTQYCCNMYSRKEFKDMELFLLELLEWELEDTPSVDFLETMFLSPKEMSEVVNDCEDEMQDDEEDDSQFNNFKQSVKYYAKMVLDTSLLNTLIPSSNNKQNDAFERLKQLFNLTLPHNNFLQQQFEHTYVSLWITMLNYPSLLALASVLTGIFLHHQYDAPFDQGQQCNFFADNNNNTFTSIEQFYEVISHYWTTEMEDNIGYSLEQVVICCRVLYTFFQIEQEKQAANVTTAPTTLVPTTNTTVRTIPSDESRTTGLDPSYLVCNEQI